MIDQSKLEIMEQQRNSSNKIIDKISILKEASKSWFQQLNANDQKLVSNQIDLLCQQKSSNDMLRALIETTDSLVTEVIETQIIAEYAAPLNNMANIARLYNRIRKGKQYEGCRESFSTYLPLVDLHMIFEISSSRN